MPPKTREFPRKILPGKMVKKLMGDKPIGSPVKRVNPNMVQKALGQKFSDRLKKRPMIAVRKEMVSENMPGPATINQ